MNLTAQERMRLLIVEDNPADVRLICEVIHENSGSRSSVRFDIAHASTLREATGLLKQSEFDLLLLDLSLPDSQGLKTFDVLQTAASATPIVILSGLSNESVAIEAMQHGAQDYLLKNDILSSNILVRSLLYAFERHRLLHQLEEKSRQLKASEQRRTKILEENPDGIVILNRDGVVQFVNPAARKILRDDRNQILEKPFSIPETKGDTAELSVKRRRGGEAQVEVRLVETEWDGEAASQLSLRDITDHKEEQHRIEKKANALAVQNIELDEFAHTMAHQVQGLLSQMIGYASFMEMQGSDELGDDMLHSINCIVQSGNKMNNVINELLLLASISNSDMPLTPLDMKRISKEVLKRLRFQIRQSGATIQLPAQWPVPCGHAPWIEEALLNYITNAIKYGGDPPVLTLGAEKLPNQIVRIWVKDNGAGISDMDQKRLFKPHTRLRKIRARGEGLGLSIVKKIVHRCGGNVGVSSIEGKGSVFWFTLPEAQPGGKTDPHETRRQLEAALSSNRVRADAH